MSTTSGGLSKILVFVLIIALGVLAYVNYAKRVQLAAELQKLSVKMEQLQTGNSEENVAAAKATVDKVRRLFSIPTDMDPTVAQIVDVDALRAKNEFYNAAKNGDFLIVTTTRAILYDPEKNVIIDVVPVQLQQPDPNQQGQAQSQGKVASSARRAASSAAPAASSAMAVSSSAQ